MGCIRTDRSYWLRGRVPCEIDGGDFPSGTDNRQAVEDAVDVWNDQTLLNLVPRNGEADFITIQAANDSCSSPVGQQGDEQAVSCDVGDGFSKWSVVHEIGHAIGLWHEQSREDRDDWVTVDLGEVEANKDHNFDKHVDDGRDIGPYDYDSLMHYGAFAFAKGDNPTITQDHPGPAIGQRDHLSDGDKKAVKFLHGQYSLRAEVQAAGKNPAFGVRQVLPNGGSVREWIVYYS